MVKVTAFGAVTVMVIALVIGGFHGPSEKVSGFLYLVPNARQVLQPERGAIFIPAPARCAVSKGKRSLHSCK
jgi:hypothetical protein